MSCPRHLCLHRKLQHLWNKARFRPVAPLRFAFVECAVVNGAGVVGAMNSGRICRFILWSVGTGRSHAEGGNHRSGYAASLLMRSAVGIAGMHAGKDVK